MRVCARCSKQFADDVSICRDCGSILDEVDLPDPGPADASSDRAVEAPNPDASLDPAPSESLQPTEREHSDEDSRSHESTASTANFWTCPTCGEEVIGTFFVCWNCCTTRGGEVDPDFEAVHDEFHQEEPKRRLPRTDPCHKCGSRRVIPDVTIGDQGQYSDGNLKAHVEGRPQAFLFRNVERAVLKGNICGECGHVELYVSDPKELFEHYLDSFGLDDRDWKEQMEDEG